MTRPRPGTRGRRVLRTRARVPARHRRAETVRATPRARATAGPMTSQSASSSSVRPRACRGRRAALGRWPPGAPGRRRLISARPRRSPLASSDPHALHRAPRRRSLYLEARPARGPRPGPPRMHRHAEPGRGPPGPRCRTSAGRVSSRSANLLVHGNRHPGTCSLPRHVEVALRDQAPPPIHPAERRQHRCRLGSEERPVDGQVSLGDHADRGPVIRPHLRRRRSERSYGGRAGLRGSRHGRGSCHRRGRSGTPGQGALAGPRRPWPPEGPNRP